MVVKHGKKYLVAAKLVDSEKAYTPEEAVELLKKAKFAKFDESVGLHLRMGVDPRASDQQVRGVALMPHGLGKKVRVLVFAQGEAVKIAEQAGADVVGGDELIKKVEEGFLEFDTTIATPDMMGRVGRLGKVLGRKGLMPNPKSGTVVPADDLPRVISDSRKGRVEFKLDKSAVIHLVIGKASFEPKMLLENLTAVIEAINKARPSGAKGQFVKSAYFATTMGPGIKLDLKTTLELTTA
jgi:large subunit ribosomal protein L1